MVEKLAASGLDMDDAAQLGMTWVDETESASLGLDRVGAGIRIPYFDADGVTEKAMFRYRYQSVEGRGFARGHQAPQV